MQHIIENQNSLIDTFLVIVPFTFFTTFFVVTAGTLAI